MVLNSTYFLHIGLILLFLKKKVYFLVHDFNNLKIFKVILKIFLRKKLLFIDPWLEESFIKKEIIN